MMRPLHVSLALAATLVPLATCDDGTRHETAFSHSRDSSLAGDLALAGDTGVVLHAGVSREPRTVTESRGTLESDGAPAANTDAPATTSSVSNVATSSPSAEGYLGPSCASPVPDDQQRCLLGYLAKSDLALDRKYEALISRLKAEAGSRGRAPEPLPVQRLRAAQRAWLVYRNDECRKRTIDREGPLWAPVRAQCLAEYAAFRTRELDDALAKRKALEAREPATKSKRATSRKSTRHRSDRR